MSGEAFISTEAKWFIPRSAVPVPATKAIRKKRNRTWFSLALSDARVRSERNPVEVVADEIAVERPGGAGLDRGEPDSFCWNQRN